ncbi:Fc.00g107990.m01.CDS01 [Cosmosporella sp. VM-42]
MAKLLLGKGAILCGGEAILGIAAGVWELVVLLSSHDRNPMETDRSGMTALEAAILSGDPDGIRFMLEKYPTIYDARALRAALRTGRKEVANLLLTNRPAHAQVNVLEATAVALAARSEDMGLLRMLLAYIPCSDIALLPLRVDRAGEVYETEERDFWLNDGCVTESPVAAAAMDSNIDALCELLKHGYQSDRLTWVIPATKNGLSTMRILVDHNQRLSDQHRVLRIQNTLIVSIRQHNEEALLLLLKAGADVNEHDLRLGHSRSPLQLAVELGNLNIIDCLLKGGADVNLPPTFYGGGTALQLAAIKGHLGIAKHLLDLGAQVNAPGAHEHGRTALEGAAEHGRLDMLGLLLYYGALTTGIGRLQYLRSVKLAAREGHYVVELLLRGLRDWSEEDCRLFKEEGLINDLLLSNWKWVEADDAIEGTWVNVVEEDDISTDWSDWDDSE